MELLKDPGFTFLLGMIAGAILTMIVMGKAIKDTFGKD